MQRGFLTYMPRVRVRGREALLFPTYLFIQIISVWYSARWTPHVVRVLMDGDRPARLPDNVVPDIRKREHGGFVRLPRAARLKPGARVRITSGQFQGHVGLYDGDAKERVRVLLDLLGRSVRVELGSQDRI